MGVVFSLASGGGLTHFSFFFWVAAADGSTSSDSSGGLHAVVGSKFFGNGFYVAAFSPG